MGGPIYRCVVDDQYKGRQTERGQVQSGDGLRAGDIAQGGANAVIGWPEQAWAGSTACRIATQWSGGYRHRAGSHPRWAA